MKNSAFSPLSWRLEQEHSQSCDKFGFVAICGKLPAFVGIADVLRAILAELVCCSHQNSETGPKKSEFHENTSFSASTIWCLQFLRVKYQQQNYQKFLVEASKCRKEQLCTQTGARFEACDHFNTTCWAATNIKPSTEKQQQKAHKYHCSMAAGQKHCNLPSRSLSKDTKIWCFFQQSGLQKHSYSSTHDMLNLFDFPKIRRKHVSQIKQEKTAYDVQP